jgi:DNA-binding LacI/PurR family transcriptional regulator
MSVDPRPRPPAMSDVALVAGVSHQTVSRVLNNHPSVRPETRERVQAAIAQLGYRRNNAARALVTRRSGAIGVVTPASGLFGPTSTLIALENAARRADIVVSVQMLQTFDADSMHDTVDRFLGQGVDGIVVVAPTTEVVGVLAGVPKDLPVVLVSAARDDDGEDHLHRVAVDNRGGARLATEHLLARGRDEVFHVAGPQDWFEAQDRLAGWRDACRDAGAPMREPIETGWQAADGALVARRLIAEGLPPAIFTANDQQALGLLHELWSAGVRVPQDVAVVGFDDEVAAQFFVPALTTVRQDFDALGEAAMGLLEAAVAGDPVVDAIIPARLVVRASSGA